jgi:cytochrome P450
MNASSPAPNAPARWDPYDQTFFKDPYPVFKRLREETPLYYNDEYDFYAVSQYEDVERNLADRDTFISGRGGIIEMIKANVTMPKGVFIFEDPPLHGIHRTLLTRVFTPKKMTALGPQIRQFCANALDPLVEEGRFNFIANLGAQMPMRVIGMLLGIPDEDQQAVRERSDAKMRTEAGKPQNYDNHSFAGEGFEDYLDWRAKNPSDDLMTELLTAEFVDETGETRKLTREEVIIFLNILAGAGNETTNRLIGWTGKVLAQHPDQRRMIYEDRSLIPQAIEEILRFEPPGPHIARYVAKDVEIHGQTVKAGSTMVMLVGSGNRDDRKFVDGDNFNIHRERIPHLTFGHGFHVCLGSALARVEGRIALDEILNRFPEWDVDLENAELSCTSTVRGWETLPAYTPKAGKASRTQSLAQSAAPETAESPQIAGAERWELTLATPMGPQEMTAQFVRNGASFTGRIDSAMGGEDISGQSDGAAMNWTMQVTKPAAIKLSFDVKIDGDTMSGKAKLGMFGNANLTGQRI